VNSKHIAIPADGDRVNAILRVLRTVVAPSVPGPSDRPSGRFREVYALTGVTGFGRSATPGHGQSTQRRYHVDRSVNASLATLSDASRRGVALGRPSPGPIRVVHDVCARPARGTRA